MVCAIPIVVGGVGCAPREGLHGWFAQSPLTLWASGGVYMVGLSNPHSGWRGAFFLGDPGWPPVAWGRGCLLIGNSDKPLPEGEEGKMEEETL